MAHVERFNLKKCIKLFNYFQWQQVLTISSANIPFSPCSCITTNQLRLVSWYGLSWRLREIKCQVSIKRTNYWNYLTPTYKNDLFERNLIIGHNISKTRDSVSWDIQTPRRELKIRRVAEYFWQNLRCLHSQRNAVSSVWYILSI